MDECQHAMEELRNIVEGISKLRDTAYAHYCLKEPEALYDFITGTLKPIPVSPSENTSQ